ncbi:beta-lactamase/transpeptidase-like protein [Astrocystis sublimbata]|nr:beta-lactamase/transpeptidase-like protein [Astrocystis sublimbata]
MLLRSLAVAVACVLIPACTAAPICPLEGPVFAKPQHLTDSEAIKGAISSLNDVFKNYTASAQNYSFALEVFSAYDPKPIFSVLHTAPKLATQNTTGVKKVDENTVFRLGSLSKVHTIYLFLINAGDEIWNAPITKYVAELKALTDGADPVTKIAWEKVTIGGIASQMTGIPRDYHVIEYGFPLLDAQERPPCGDFPTCSREQFFTGLEKTYPSLPPFTAAAYSNVGFQLLGYAIEDITGKPFETLLKETMLEPLGMNNTFLRAPDQARGIIPGNPDKTGWTFDLGESAAAGNIYSSIGDLSALGRSMLNYKLLDPAITRRWLKPFSFSTDQHASVGAPWGARRVNVAGQPNRWITAFNKAGRINVYSSVLGIIPDYDIGISILLAGELPSNANFGMMDIVGEILIPAVEEAARAETGAKYNGHFAFSNTTALNSSLTIETDDQPGLKISQWISNGTNFGYIATFLQAGYLPVTPRIRLYPTGLEAKNSDGSSKVAFKAVFEDAAVPSLETAMFSTTCASWMNVASIIYGSAAMDELIFNVDAEGKVVSITSPSLRVTLDKK